MVRIPGVPRGILKVPKRLLFDRARRTGQLPVDALIAALHERLERLPDAPPKRTPRHFRRKPRRGTYKVERVY